MIYKQKDSYCKQVECNVIYSHNIVVHNLQEEYGKCIIDIPKPSLVVYLVKELTAPFFIL